MEVVAPTTPLLASRGPLRPVSVSAEEVRPPMNDCAPVKVLLAYVFGIVVEASAKKMAEVVEKKLVSPLQ